jgi:hypothetical protein
LPPPIRARERTAMSIGTESVGKVERAKRAVGSILNLLRYQRVATLEEAETRLRLLDEFAVEAFIAIDDVKTTEFPHTEDSSTTLPRSSIYLGQSFSELRGHLRTRH